jgi:hypothetical protein
LTDHKYIQYVFYYICIYPIREPLPAKMVLISGIFNLSENAFRELYFIAQ